MSISNYLKLDITKAITSDSNS